MAYLAPDTIGGGPYLAPEEPPGVTPPPDPSNPQLNIYTIMRYPQINLTAQMGAPVNITGNLL